MMSVATRQSPRPLRVLHVVGGMNRGGVETWLMHMLRTVDREDCVMDFLVHTDRPCAYDDEIRAAGSAVLPCMKPDRPWAYARNFRRIIESSGPYDVIHSHVYLFTGFVLGLARRMNVPGRIAHIYPAVDAKATTPLRGLYRSAMRECIRRHSTHLVSCSRYSLEAFRKGWRGRNLGADVIYPFTKELAPTANVRGRDEVRRRYGLPTDRPLVVYVARFAPHKNHAQMVRVADLMRRRGVDAHFAMVGSHGALLDHFVRLSASRDDISVLTDVADVTELLAGADVFFFPTLDEGFGIVATEAAACGLPVVASELPPLYESIPPANRWLMFPPGDDVAAADRLQALILEPGRRSAAAIEAGKWAAGMSPARSVDALLSIYRCSRR